LTRIRPALRGGISGAGRAKAIYAALSIEHQPIEPHQPWQSYIETHFGIQRRLSDYYFARATTWVELQKVHERFVRDYTEQEHWAHRHREDGKRSPGDVLDWVIGTPHDPAVGALAPFAGGTRQAGGGGRSSSQPGHSRTT
jgi:hypothetical protein